MTIHEDAIKVAEELLLPWQEEPESIEALTAFGLRCAEAMREECMKWPSPNNHDQSGGWSIDPTFLEKVAKEVNINTGDPVSWEQVESVLLVATTIHQLKVQP